MQGTAPQGQQRQILGQQTGCGQPGAAGAGACKTCKEGISSRGPAAGALSVAGDSRCTVLKIPAGLWMGSEQPSCASVADLVALRAVAATPLISCPDVAHHQGSPAVGDQACGEPILRTTLHALADTGGCAAVQIPDGPSREAARREGTQFQITSFLKPKQPSSELWKLVAGCSCHLMAFMNFSSVA